MKDTTKKPFGIDRSKSKSKRNRHRSAISDGIFWPLFVAIILGILFIVYS